jgi:hypothetical protein
MGITSLDIIHFRIKKIRLEGFISVSLSLQVEAKVLCEAWQVK